MKNWFVCFVICMCLLFSVSSAETPYIIDPAGVFDGADTQKLLEACKEVEEMHGYLVRIETSASSSSSTIQERAKAVFEEKYGADAFGFLYFVDVVSNDHWIHLSGDLAQNLSAVDALEAAQKAFDKGDCAEAAKQAVLGVWYEWYSHLDQLEQETQLKTEAANIAEKTEEVTRMVKEHFASLRRVENALIEESIEARKAKREMLSELHGLLADYIAYLMQHQNQIVTLLAE